MKHQVFKLKCYGQDLIPGDVTKLGRVINLSQQVGRVSGRVVAPDGSLKAVSLTPDRQYDIHRVLAVPTEGEIDAASETKS